MPTKNEIIIDMANILLDNADAYNYYEWRDMYFDLRRWSNLREKENGKTQSKKD